VFKFTVTTFEKSVVAAAEDLGITVDDIDFIIPHQVNERILTTISKRLRYPLDRMYRNLHRYGNTSAASVPVALDEARRDGFIKRGQTVLMIGFGAGFTWGTAVMEW
jgi:3-oxoacyl-[acyl-carrier-protein] synthase-3